MQIRPGGGNPQPGAVREHEDELQLAMVGGGTEELQRLAIEGVTRPPDGDPLRIAVRVLVVGIVSCSPSTAWTGNTSPPFSTTGYVTA